MIARNSQSDMVGLLALARLCLELEDMKWIACKVADREASRVDCG